MSDELPESLRLKLYRKYVSAIAGKRGDDAAEKKNEDPEGFVWGKLSDDKARELMSKLKALYPDVYRPVVQELYRLLKDGVLKELDGLTVLRIIRALGLNIRPELRIKFVKDGKEVDIDEYLE